MGFFTTEKEAGGIYQDQPGRNPFQGGMGFFTEVEDTNLILFGYLSQSLSGWDGVFHGTQMGHSRGDNL